MSNTINILILLRMHEIIFYILSNQRVLFLFYISLENAKNASTTNKSYLNLFIFSLETIILYLACLRLEKYQKAQ